MDAQDTMLEQVLRLCESLASLTRSLTDPASVWATEAPPATDSLQAAAEREDGAVFG